MLFSSVSFLYGFMPAALLCYFIAALPVMPVRLKNIVLLVFSLLFYAFGEPVYVSLLVISSVSDYIHSLYIEKHRGRKKAKAALISSVVVNLAMLGFFKYVDFFISTINSIFGLALPLTGVPLPIGISFFTFQTMSYTIDVYRGRVHAQKSLADLATFVCLFPQLIAGPIVRYTDVVAELEQRCSTLEGVAAGLSRFAAGLGKKVLIANTMGQFCELFRSGHQQSVLFFWLYALAFTLQIYFDFSGYSDMAIGLGRVFGFNFPENFDYPYISRSITEFWRRWHMTLGSWFRDYVYIPLGGNRTSVRKWLRNLAIVWLLTGLWHGAQWNFVLWGVFYGALLMAEKLWFGKWLNKAPSAVGHIYTLAMVIVGFVVFNANGLMGTVSDLKAMFGLSGLPAVTYQTLYYLKSYGVTFAVAIVGSTPLVKKLAYRIDKNMPVLQPLVTAALLVLSTASLIDGSFNPFLYFRF